MGQVTMVWMSCYLVLLSTENKTRWQEQLERLRSEDTPAVPWLPILLIHIGPQIKTRQSQSYKFKESAKTFI